MSELLFVYGTLRPGTRHPRSGLLAGEEEVGSGRILAKLYDVGPYPAAIPSDRPEDVVRGDVFRLRVPDSKLRELDEEEGCPAETAPAEELFRRERVEVSMEDGRRLIAWVYYWNRTLERLAPIPSGDYLAHFLKSG